MDTKYMVKSAERVLDLVEAFGDHKQPMNLSVLAKRIGIPVSSCHGLVKTLQRRGYLYAVDANREIYPTKRLFRIAETINAHDPLLEWLVPELQALRDLTGETVILGKGHDHAIIYLEVVEGTATIRYAAAAGEQKPLYSSAIGKALLSSLEASRRTQLLTQLALKPITPNTITDHSKLEKDFRDTRQRGFSITRGENVVDVMAIAVAVETASDTLGIAIAGPLQRMEKNLDHCSGALLALGARLSTGGKLRGDIA